MMKKLICLFLLCAFTAVFSQKNKKVAPAPITAETAEQSNDPQVIAKFIKANPDHPKTPALKSKLIGLISPKDDYEAKPTVAPLTKDKLAKQVNRDLKDGVNDKSKQAAQVLNHLFDNNPNKKEAYVQIINKSKCNLVVKFAGRKFYNLDVKANNQNFILIDKGSYKMTTSICDAKYDATKSITKDLSITLHTR